MTWLHHQLGTHMHQWLHLYIALKILPIYSQRKRLQRMKLQQQTVATTACDEDVTWVGWANDFFVSSRSDSVKNHTQKILLFNKFIISHNSVCVFAIVYNCESSVFKVENWLLTQPNYLTNPDDISFGEGERAQRERVPGQLPELVDTLGHHSILLFFVPRSLPVQPSVTCVSMCPTLNLNYF